jgi:hypothetical protein
MKLDRNVNPNKKGKYCLINLRKTPLLSETEAVHDALVVLNKAGLLHWGHESPEDQFFVMKYKDLFTQDGLLGYALAIKEFAEKGMSENRLAPKDFDNWMEYHREILAEAEAAKLCNHHLPS